MGASNISTYLSHKILNFLLGRQSAVVPSFFKLALSTQPLGDEGVGLTEPTDPSYQRLTIPNNRISFSVASDRITTIISQLAFDESSENWDRVTHFVIFDDLNNVWFYGELQNSIDVEIETSPIIYPNTNNLSFDICGGSTSDSAISTNVANSILNHFLGNSPILTVPSTFYLGISSLATSPEGIGFREPTASEYHRIALPNDKNTFTAANNKAVSINQEFRFSAASVAWGNITHYFISSTPTGENVWWSGKLIHPRNVEISTTLVVKPQGLKWVLDSCGLMGAIAPLSADISFEQSFWGK